MSEQAKRAQGIFVINGTTIYQEMVSAEFPAVTAEKIDTTTHNNAGGFTSKMCGWLTAEDVKFVVNFYGQADQITLYTAGLSARTITPWIFGIPNFAAVTCNAYVAGSKILTPI